MALNEKVDILVYKRKLTVEMEGLTPMEISSLASLVEERMVQISESNNTLADSGKLAILAALEFAAEKQKSAASFDTQMRALEHKVEELSVVLQSVLAK